jgi:hypothetical protein
MKHLPQTFSSLFVEGPMNSVRLRGTPAKSGWEASVVEVVDSIARRLVSWQPNSRAIW